MKRAMSVWFPSLGIDAWRRRDRVLGAPRDDRPLLLVDTVRQRRAVVHCCERAAAAGIRPGIPVPDATALLSDGQARIEQHRPARERSTLRALAIWAHRFSPVVAIDEPDGLLIDVSGCEAVFRGERRLIGGLLHGCRRLGFAARAAISPTFGCSWGIARFGDDPAAIIPHGQQRAGIQGLPVRALRLEEASLAGIAALGVERIEQLMALPRTAIPVRFGDAVLLRLDQSLGSAMEVIEPVRPACTLRVERPFDGPTTQTEAIELTVKELLPMLCDRMLTLESGARTVDIRLDRADLEPAGVRIALSRPSRDPAHLWSLIRPRLERLHLGYGVDRIELSAPWIAPLQHRQAECWDQVAISNQESARRAGELIDTLAGRLGGDRVLRPAVAPSHIPERAITYRTATVDSGTPPAATTHAPPARRPGLVFACPSAAQVISVTPDGPVIGVNWRGRELRVLACVGPERLGAEWWRGQGATRDYFMIQDDAGRWLWIYRELQSGWWFVHGIWS